MTQAARHYRWDDIPKEKLNDLLDRRLVTGERIMLAHVYLKKGCVVPRHPHENEQLTYILQGTLRFWLGEDGKEQVDVHAGEVLTIPSNLPHKAEALEDTLDVDIFCPPRQDWLDKTDAYLRGALSVELGLRGKVALVAASSRGLGYAIAHELAAEGAAIVMCARGEERLKQAAREIAEATGARVVAGAPATCAKLADVASDRAARARASSGASTCWSRTPAVRRRGRSSRPRPEAWKAAVDVLLTSAVELIRAVLPGMKERRFGRILNVTSITVKQPVENLILSNALRAAVTGMARTLASEVAPFGITVNNLLPGYTRTERLDRAGGRDRGARRDGEEFYARLETEIPARRLGEPRELAALAAFLASERAALHHGPVDRRRRRLDSRAVLGARWANPNGA